MYIHTTRYLYLWYIQESLQCETTHCRRKGGSHYLALSFSFLSFALILSVFNVPCTAIPCIEKADINACTHVGSSERPNRSGLGCCKREHVLTERERKGTKSKRMGGCVYVCVRSAVNAEMQETREKYVDVCTHRIFSDT